MSTKTTMMNAADYLDTPEDIAAYLNAAFKEGDPALITAAIGDIARLKGMTEIARKTGLARPPLYRILSERGNPAFGTVIRVLDSLDLHLEATPITTTDAA